jgi:hypothetical protein
MALANKSFVFQTDSHLVKSSLNEPNYLIEYSKDNLDKKYCIVYFSSHNIYYPNTEHNFKKNILVNNKFEWFGLRIKKGYKHIFIRDIQKQWYLKGINNQINSIEKIKIFLENEIKGYKTIMIGSSAGGYAAVLFGSLLNSEYIYSFNGQFKVDDLLESSSELIDPIIFREKDNLLINKYFSIKKFINNPNKIFYFHSNKSNWDLRNKNHISDTAINIIEFRTSVHGIPFVKSALGYVINANLKKLISWNMKTFNPIFFSIKYGGLIETVKVLSKKLKSIK